MEDADKTPDTATSPSPNDTAAAPPPKSPKAKIPRELEETCDRYGEEVIGMMLATGFIPRPNELQDIHYSNEKVEQARVWLTERSRSRQLRERITFALEIVVVLLILGEILLSLWDGHLQAQNFEKQQQVLTNLQNSSAETFTSLQKLVAAQDASLKIQQAEEADRLAQLAKKPKLVLYVGHASLLKARGPLKPTQETDTTATFDIVLRNAGEATANKIIWRALLPPDVYLTSSNPAPMPGNDLPDRPVHAFLYFQDLMPPKGYTEVTVTFMFPKGHAPFPVTFNASSPEIIGETPLGVLQITPRTPSH